MAPARDHDRTRRSYDAVAADYLEHFDDELAHKPLDRALLTALLEQAGAGAPIADLGCGPGHVAAWLAERGATAVGIDLSPQMVEVGRRAHPNVEFRQGDLLALTAADGEFAASVALYSIIHLEPSELPAAFAEMHRVLRAGGRALVSFHQGSEVRHRDEWWGHPVDVDFHFCQPDAVVGGLEGAGFVIEAQLQRRNYPDEVDTTRGYVLARRD